MRGVVYTVAVIACISILLISGESHRISAQDGNLANDNCLSGYSYPAGLIPSHVCIEVNQVQERIDRVERSTLKIARSLAINPGTRLDQIRILGRLLLYDKSYSVRR